MKVFFRKVSIMQIILFAVISMISCGIPENVVGFQFTDSDENVYQIVTDDVLYSENENFFRYYDYYKGESKKDSIISISWVGDYNLSDIKLTKIPEDQNAELLKKLEKAPESLVGCSIKNENVEYYVLNEQYILSSDNYYYTYIYNTNSDGIDGKIRIVTSGSYKEFCLFDAEVSKMDESKRAQLEKEMNQDFTRYEILETEKASYIGKNKSFRELTFNNKNRMNGDDVAILQDALYSLGYTDVGEVDGWYGPKTDKALKQFQKDYGLEENGIFDENCFNVMIKSLYKNEIENGSIDSYKQTKEAKREVWFDNAEIQLSSMFYGSTKTIKKLFSDFPESITVTKEIGEKQAKIHLTAKAADVLVGELECVFSYSKLSPSTTCTLTEVTLNSMGDTAHSKVYTTIYKEPENAGECFGIMYMALMTFSMLN